MSKISRFFHWCIVELLIIHTVCNWDYAWLDLSVEHMITESCIKSGTSFPCRAHALSPWNSALDRFSLLSQKLYGSSVKRCELESLCRIFYRSIKIFSFCFWSIIVVFTCHHLEIMLILVFYHFNLMSLWWFWVYWLSSLPIIPKYINH